MQPTNVILFVGDHSTSLSASSVGQVGCESTIIIHGNQCSHVCYHYLQI